MTDVERQYIAVSLSRLVEDLMMANPRLVPGEIYDALAAELEKRCDRIIRGESFSGEP